MAPKGHPKALEKKEKEAAEKAEKASAKSKASEDAYWKEAGEGQVSKAAAKRAEEEAKRAEAAAKRAEAKRLAEEEEAALTARKAKAQVPSAQKITKHQLDNMKDAEARQKEEELREKLMAAKREMSAEAYAAFVDQEVANRRDDATIDARSVADALEQLGIAGAGEEDKHPEKRLRAAYKAYEEAQLPQLKQDKPGLKMSQYKDMLWKMWQKAPENPMVAAGKR